MQPLELNTKLSQARADAVAQALVSQHGIAASRLAARGVGARNDGRIVAYSRDALSNIFRSREN